MKHCMIDLETWGVTPGCMIRSMGAQVFELDGPVGGKFYANILEDNRFFKETSTAEWWSKQSAEAQEIFTKNPKPLGKVLEEFSVGFKDAGCQFIWSHGSIFDIVLLEHAYRVIGFEIPWHHRSVRDTRTWYQANNFDPKSVIFQGVKHNALDDACHQVRCVQAAYRMMMPPLKMTDPVSEFVSDKSSASGFGLRFK